MNGSVALNTLKTSLQNEVDGVVNAKTSGSDELKVRVRQYLNLAKREGNALHLSQSAKMMATLERTKGNRVLLFYYDSLRVAYARLCGQPDTLFQSLHSYTHDLINMNKVTEASPLLLEAIRLADSLKKPNYQTAAYLNKGAWLFKQMDMEESIMTFRHTMELARSYKNYDKVAESRLWMANAHLYSGNFDSTFADVFECLNYYRKQNDKSGLAESYSVLGQAYQFNGNADKSLEYIRLAKNLYKEENDFLNEINHLQKLAQVYASIGMYDTAFLYIEEAESAFKGMNYQMGVAMVNTLKGSVYTMKGEVQTAKRFFKLAEEINKTEKNNMLNLANSGYAMINAIRAEDSVTVADLLPGVTSEIKKHLPKTLVDDAAKRLTRAGILHAKLDSADLHEHFGSVLLTSSDKDINPFTNVDPDLDSLIGAKNNRLLTEMETKYKTRLKDDSLSAEKRNMAIAVKSLQTRNIVISLIGLVTILIIVGFIQQLRNRKRAEKDKAQIQILQKELHHRVTNNLAGIISMIEIAGSEVNTQDAFIALQNRVRAIELLHKKLYQGDFAIGKVSLQPYLEELVRLIRPTFSSVKQINTVVNANVDLEIFTMDKIGLIVNELVTNSFKYAFSERSFGTIDITMKASAGGGYLLTVSDDGSGFNPAIRSKSYGMILIQGLSHALNGKPKFSFENGTRFELELPQGA